MDEKRNRERTEEAFREWQDGTGYITYLLADDLEWTIVGRSRSSKTYASKEAFVGEVLEPFGARFSERFRPVAVHGIYADGDTVVVHWDGEGTRLDGKPYENAYAWIMRFRGGWWWRRPPSTTASPSTSCGTRSPRRASRNFRELPF